MRLCYDTVALAEEEPVTGVLPLVPQAPIGRPYAFTEQKQAEYLENIRNGDTRALAARNVDVDPKTVRAHRRLFPEFTDAILEAEHERIRKVESAGFKVAMDGNPSMIQFMLRNGLKDQYQERKEPAVLQQINAGQSVEWSLQEARAEVLGMIDELEAKRREKAEEQQAIDAPSREVDGG